MKCSLFHLNRFFFLREDKILMRYTTPVHNFSSENSWFLLKNLKRAKFFISFLKWKNIRRWHRWFFCSLITRGKIRASESKESNWYKKNIDIRSICNLFISYFFAGFLIKISGTSGIRSCCWNYVTWCISPPSLKTEVNLRFTLQKNEPKRMWIKQSEDRKQKKR